MRRRDPVVAALVGAATATLLTGCAAGPVQVAGARPVPSPSISVLDVPVVTATATSGSAFRTAADGTLLPDAGLTPGDVLPGTSREVVCAPGFGADSHRVRSTAKDRALASYGVSDTRSEYSVVHLVPVSLGGSDEQTNLWPQPKAGAFAAAAKSELDAHLTALVCAGAVPLEEARTALVTDWRAAADRYLPVPVPAGVTAAS